jgi:type II secretory ATPase GspE/PulE/Tfp pilus assembly ATPase PilB-like protein
MEVLLVDAEIRRRIIRGDTSHQIRRYAVAQGMQTLAHDGWQKVLLGNTALEEVYGSVGAAESA